MIKYTPYTRAAVSIAERGEKIQELYKEMSNLFESLRELLPIGQLMIRYSQAKTKQDRMRDQINFLNRALEDLRKENSTFIEEENESLFSNFQTQTSISNLETDKLLKQIRKAEVSNIKHSMSLKLSQIPIDSDLNQEAADDILLSYIEKLQTLNETYEEICCSDDELHYYLKFLKEDESRYEDFKQETNDTIQRLQDHIDTTQIEIQRQQKKIEKLKKTEEELITDFQEKMNMLKDVSESLDKFTNEEDIDATLAKAVSELFYKLQDPNSNDSDIDLTISSILHLTNLNETQVQHFPSKNDQPMKIKEKDPSKTSPHEMLARLQRKFDASKKL